MPFFVEGERRIYYEISGYGRPLLFISGLSGGSWSWYKQRPFFEAFYRVITFDNRGAGRSWMPPGPYTMEQMAEDTLALLDHLAIEKVHVVGISMGGMIAQQLAATHPNRLSALVLGCTHCGKKRRIPPSPEVLSRLTNQEGLSAEEIVEKNIPLLFGNKCRSEHPEIVEEYKRNTLSSPLQPLEAFQAQIAAINKFDVCSILDRITCPVLVITGKDDILVPPENSKILVELIPYARLVELEEVGHLLHLEAYDTFNRIVREFLLIVEEEQEFPPP
ncbi:MAG: alpha/beta hydrolase [Syntrophobacterales bacterium]|nr:alpha/beta hydrolase [Syntrophobacterales bacterium]